MLDLYPNFWDNLKKNRNRGHNYHIDRGKTKLNNKYSVNSKVCKKGEKQKLDTNRTKTDKEFKPKYKLLNLNY